MPFCADEAESFVETTVGVGEARNIFEMMRREKFSSAFLICEMDESEVGAQGFNGGTNFFDFANGFSAERATEVAQENEKDRPGLRKSGDILAGLREIGMNKFWKGTRGRRHFFMFADMKQQGNGFERDSHTMNHGASKRPARVKREYLRSELFF